MRRMMKRMTGFLFLMVIFQMMKVFLIQMVKSKKKKLIFEYVF